MVVTAALLGAAGVKLGRYLNAIFGAWLILSSILRPGLDRVTFWNYLLVGAGLVLFALTASLHGLRRRSVADVSSAPGGRLGHAVATQDGLYLAVAISEHDVQSVAQRGVATADAHGDAEGERQAIPVGGR